MIWARVVLPVPGGPHRMMDEEEAVSLDGAAQQAAGADGSRPGRRIRRGCAGAGGRRGGFGGEALLEGVVEEVHIVKV